MGGGRVPPTASHLERGQRGLTGVQLVPYYSSGHDRTAL